jgi:hypothetical protein
MRYMLLIYSDESNDLSPGDPGFAELMDGYRAFGEEARSRGAYELGEPLAPTSSASTVRVRDGKSMVTDGPFAETKEQLGGFYLINCKGLDEALELAARIPGAQRGCVEVRPILELG